MPWKSIPVEQRIAARTGPVDPETGCYDYLPADHDKPVNAKRAMYVKIGRKTVSVLRVVWDLHHKDPVPTWRQVRHNPKLCKSKRCINPEHLILTVD